MTSDALASLNAATSRDSALSLLTEAFRAAGIDEPAREARLVLRCACGLTPVELFGGPERPLGASVEALRTFAARRLAREPLSRIVGRREFWGLDFALAPDALDPRPETETLVEAALAAFGRRREHPLRLLDLGVGSGALLAALLKEFPCAEGVGIDLSPQAARIAAENLRRLGFAARGRILVGSWTEPLAPVSPREARPPTAARFDLIVSNPPYISSAEIVALMPEVRDHDPPLALDGGPDGLDAYRALLPAAAPLLLPGGWLMVEIGAGQADDVLALAAQAGLADGATRPDLAGVTRVVMARAAV